MWSLPCFPIKLHMDQMCISCLPAMHIFLYATVVIWQSFVIYLIALRFNLYTMTAHPSRNIKPGYDPQPPQNVNKEDRRRTWGTVRHRELHCFLFDHFLLDRFLLGVVDWTDVSVRMSPVWRWRSYLMVRRTESGKGERRRLIIMEDPYSCMQDFWVTGDQKFANIHI